MFLIYVLAINKKITSFWEGMGRDISLTLRISNLNEYKGLGLIFKCFLRLFNTLFHNLIIFKYILIYS